MYLEMLGVMWHVNRIRVPGIIVVDSGCAEQSMPPEPHHRHKDSHSNAAILQFPTFLSLVAKHIMEVKQAFEYFALLEQQFWKNLDQKTIQHVTFAGDLKPEDMLLYGEFGFALLGLKPAVLVEFCDEAINALYLETVVEPVLYAMKEKTLGYHIIRHAVTPESGLNGCIFIYQTKQRTLPELAFIMSNTATATTDTEMSEESMATILDYPGHLPSTEKEIATMLSH
ncbi:hypothetical protein MBANPS3_001257 [Mucor bainieri]